MIPEIFTRYPVEWIGSLTAVGGAIFAQTSINDPTSAIGTTSLFIGTAGLVTALSAAAKPFWEDRQKERDDRERERQSQERQLKLRMSLSLNNRITRQLWEWANEAHKSSPTVPRPPDWIDLQEDGHDSREYKTYTE